MPLVIRRSRIQTRWNLQAGLNLRRRICRLAWHPFCRCCETFACFVSASKQKTRAKFGEIYIAVSQRIWNLSFLEFARCLLGNDGIRCISAMIKTVPSAILSSNIFLSDNLEAALSGTRLLHTASFYRIKRIIINLLWNWSFQTGLLFFGHAGFIFFQ